MARLGRVEMNGLTFVLADAVPAGTIVCVAGGKDGETEVETAEAADRGPVVYAVDGPEFVREQVGDADRITATATYAVDRGALRRDSDRARIVVSRTADAADVDGDEAAARADHGVVATGGTAQGGHPGHAARTFQGPPVERTAICPTCKGIARIGKHRDDAACKQCGGRGWIIGRA